MKLEHKIKLIPARMRWLFLSWKDARDTLNLLRSENTLKILREAYWDKYIETDRNDRSNPEGIAAKAKVEMLDELIKMSDA